MKKQLDVSERSREIIQTVRSGMAETIVGQQSLVDGILIACIAGGHVLLEGVPGLAKTLAVKTFAGLSALSFKRIQFTPDLLPADLVGTLIYNREKADFPQGPVFSIWTADEAPANSAACLRRCMNSRLCLNVCAADFVLATQNPIEQEGTLARSRTAGGFCSSFVPYPSMEEEHR